MDTSAILIPSFSVLDGAEETACLYRSNLVKLEEAAEKEPVMLGLRKVELVRERG